MIGTFIYPPERALGVFEELQALDYVFPADLGVQLGISYSRTTNTSLVTENLKTFGNWSTFLPYWATAKRLGSISSDIQNVTLVEPFGLDGPARAERTSPAVPSGSAVPTPRRARRCLRNFAFHEAFSGSMGETIFQRYANNNTRKLPLSTAV